MRSILLVAALLGVFDSVTSFAEPGAKTPIKHLIVIVGENRSFDHLFATYVPPKSETVMNLLSQGIVKSDGTPGPNFAKAEQWQATDTDRYSITPRRTEPYEQLPQPNTTHAMGLPLNAPDSRFPANLPNGPFQITKYLPYQLSYTGDPVHRFFQMWQQYDGGRNDLFTWVGTTIGSGSNGEKPPAPFNAQATHQGGVAMGFYNMSQGDAPVFKFVAQHYAMSDNYHQGIMGGTGASFIYLGTGDAAFYNDGNGNPLTPPKNQIENPDPVPGTNNWYAQDGFQGGTYVNCADPKQPGAAAILDYLKSIGRASRCDTGHYYLVNNYGPAYNPNGTAVDVKQRPFTLPPQTLPNIGEALNKAGVSWKYYIGGFGGGNATEAWCAICNPLQFSKGVMTTALRGNILDVPDFFRDVADRTLPAVSFVRPYEPHSGHPGNSTVSGYEYFVLSVTNAVINNRKLFDDTAMMITFDEGGGYYDSGYIQPLDFFGDGTRIPLLVVSPWVRAGRIDHTYTDHASILKFIEANWNIAPVSSRSRDNFPNPETSAGNPYIPANAPALGDLMGVFDFSHKRTPGDAPVIIAPGV